MKTIIHVNRHLIARNRCDGGNRPVYAVKQGRKTIYTHAVTIHGTTTFIDPRSEPPLPCGATVYAAVEGEIELKEPVSYHDIEANVVQDRDSPGHRPGHNDGVS